jgi:hypothetical protein
VAVNVRLGKEEEEALCREGNNNNDNSYRGRGGRGGGKKGKWFVERSLSWEFVSFTVTILTSHLFHYLYSCCKFCHL